MWLYVIQWAQRGVWDHRNWFMTWMVSSHVYVFHPKLAKWVWFIHFWFLLLKWWNSQSHKANALPKDWFQGQCDLNCGWSLLHWHLIVLTINGSLWNLRPMVILTNCVISIFFSAIALMFGNLILKIDINTQFY